jgi:hypothetical protein
MEEKSLNNRMRINSSNHGEVQSMKTQRAIIILLLISVFVLTAASPYPTVRLTVINKTGEEVIVKLNRPENVYLLKVKGSLYRTTEKVFSVEKGTYEVNVWACGGKETIEDLEIQNNYRFTIPRCYSQPRFIPDGYVRKFLYSPT